MRHAPAILLLAGMVLCGCSVAQSPSERLAADVAVCQRHAKEGPGGPSAMVGGRNYVSPRLNRAGLWEMPNTGSTVSPETVYRECLELRGHPVSSNRLVPVNPNAIGVREGSGNPV
jgi:hypothetical protein